ncbi:MAG: hypothetical protein RR554_04780 [Vagococcus sp.]|uniref:hypothetical protein n=1 Tax=Vagococcus sp. TaxID=1933889 RepID=UPI002FC852DC
MCIIKDKEDHYNSLLLGNEICINDDIIEKFSSCWTVSRAVRVTEKTLALIDISQKDSNYATLVLSTEHGPIVTTKSTNTLMKNFRKEVDKQFNIIKEVVETIIQKEIYCFPDISPKMLMIPLEGSSCKEATYINFTMLTDVDKYSDYQSILSFHNYLELVIDKPFGTIREKFLRCFKYHSIYCYMDNQLSREKKGFDYLNSWEGNYYRSISGVQSEVKYLIDVESFRKIKDIAFLNYAEFSDEELYAVLDR